MRNMDFEKLRVFAARSGELSVEINGIPYHSLYDPVKEADRFCSGLKIEDADVILLFGWGLGYIGDAIQSRMKQDARLIVFEPDPDLFEMSRDQAVTREALGNRRVQFVLGPEIPH